jgi:hypothetical protein
MPKDKISEKIRLGDLASNRDPRRASWGYYASDENVCGVGLFFWFNTREELLEFLSEYEGVDSECHEPELLLGQMRKVADQIRAGRLGLEEARQQFNELLKGHLDVEWIGNFDEMLSGNHPFCIQMREDFLEIEDESTVPAVAPRQVKDFIEMLSGYGH